MMPIAVPEIDHDVESRMLRSIRRRFFWMSGVQLTFGAVGLVAIFTRFGTVERHSLGGWFTWGQSLLNLGLIVVAVAHVRRTRLDRAGLMRLIYALVVTGAMIDVGGDRLAFALLRRAPSVDDAFLSEALLLTSVRFFFAALFIRWSLREALAIAGTLLGITLGVAVTFVALPVAPTTVHVALLSPLCYVPGLLICWWSHSRLVARFRAQFEIAQYRRLRSELTSARKLHESVLPAPVTDGPFRLSYQYEPMREIGGDLVLLRRGDPGDPSAAPTLIVLDVTGHGIAAALTVNRLVGEVERLFGENPAISPCQVIRALDRYIALTLAHHGIFATACCARLDCAEKRLTWCSGGHPPAFVCRADGTVEQLGSTAPLLGADCEVSDDDERHAAFEPGDVLVCYTDGAIEAATHGGAMIGIDGLQRLVAGCASARLPPGDWPAAVLAGVQRYRGAPPEDDTLITVLHCPAGG